MNKIFAESEEKYLKAVLVFGKTSDSYAYADSEFTTKISKDQLLNSAKKGLVVFYKGVFFNPVCFKEDAAGFAKVTIWDAEAETPAAITLNSKEYSAS